MAKLPIILVIDDNLQVLAAIERDLRGEFRNDYRILKASSAKQALDFLQQLKLKKEIVALLLSDQRMPEMEGVDFLELALKIFPETKTVLLTAYADTQAAINAINKVSLDYYLIKPWDPPEEKLFPILRDLLNDWQVNYKPEFTGIKVIGFQWSPKSHEIKDFLAGNLVPYQWFESDNEEAQPLLNASHTTKAELPIVIFEDGSSLKDPSLSQIATKIGLGVAPSQALYDVVIIGAGPSGLAASVYGASEGLKTLLIERRAPGGQAGTSSRIENYLGFPAGVTGAELTKRAITQASRFGTEFLTPREVKTIVADGNYKIIELSEGKKINARAIVITTGVSYRILEVPGMHKLNGAGIYYGAASTEAIYCKDCPIYIVGGGNSAGQAAMYLSKYASEVHIIIRGTSLAASMSSYLIDQITSSPNIKVNPFTEVTEVHGDNQLEKVSVYNSVQDSVSIVPAKALFVFIGAKPSTDWLDGSVIKDKKGFIVTGRDLIKHDEFAKSWKVAREPYLLETSIPGIFASGDVRSGAMARVASAVGEGSMAIKFVHEYLAES
ncbi:MAG TPA: FAD-dependent oxidoreductase [Cytophagaceae bacterium]|jgi:thioredoxin reductase (NADPH)